jgi:basic amino acid/polyamine antiporter, APA family
MPATENSSNPPPAAQLDLVRGLGPWASIAIVVGTMIGTGIFLVPSSMARDARSIGLVFFVWIFGGVLSLFGALTYAELGAAIPAAGGDYAYLNRGFGPKWGYLFGWMHSIIGRPCSAATIAAGLLKFIGFLYPVVNVRILQYPIWVPFTSTPYEIILTPAQPLAVVAIALVSGVNYLGVRLGGQIQVFLTALKIGAVLAIVGFGFALGHGSAANFHPLLPASMGLATVTGVLTALVAALWAYDGWSNIGLVGSEIIEPQKNIPRALVGGVAAVGGIYLLATAVYFYVLPFAAVQNSGSVAAEVVAKFAGFRAAKWITIAMIISALGTLNSSILSGARVPFAMSRDNLFFRFAGDIHEKFRTPGGALVFQAYLASILALTGTFDDLFSLFIFAQWIFYGLVTASVFGLRRREPELPRPYRTWGYPWVPIAFCAGAFALTLNLWWQRPIRSSIGLGLILVGLLFYDRWRKQPTPSAEKAKN